ncbi:MAG: TusE/DsrC/DsvC family sulfur relay protein [Candidatus Latescibacterota bacterium]|nr:MAG: TusE/DsrC/DsvC family sulfur relay protein [Candidatus Latescibacterota bacterium]
MPEEMMTLENGKTYTLDRHGFLDPPDQWDAEFAVAMAQRVGIHDGLTEAHWEFIRYLRTKFLEEKTVPVVVIACADNGMRLGKLRSLFPTGYHRGACKIAGINYDFMYKHNIWLTYESYRLLKANYNMSPNGFLADFDRWDRQFAYLIVTEWDLPLGLSDRHWQVIDYLRDHYRKTHDIPTIFEVCKDLELTLADLRNLFPEGYRRGACRAAGLPFLP